MNTIKSSSKNDILVIVLFIIVFILVIFVFYSEILKNNKIRIAEKNFNIVQNVLLEEIKKCSTNQENWIFGVSCNQNPLISDILSYFNQILNLKNPYNNFDGVGIDPGSVQVIIQDKIIILLIDVDANGGGDIEHHLFF